uniref:Uncharacterized protein n=2 Tax=Avena sativa TaxID=4498 RepID=A0ACD6A233_AVESA
MAKYRRSWSDIPSELAGLVLLRLPAHSDRIRFAAVCRHWCVSARQQSLPPPLPWFILPGGTFFSLPHSESFQVPNGAEFHSSCGEWLVFSHDETCSLVNTFSKATWKLPDLDIFDRINEPHEIINGHDIAYTLLEDVNVTMSIHKVIICLELLVAAIVDVGDLETLALCRPGGDQWFVSPLGYDRSLDIIFHEGKLYMVDGWRNLYIIDVEEDGDSSSLFISRIECIIEGPPWPFRLFSGGLLIFDTYLVESRGALLLIRGTIYGKPPVENHSAFETRAVGFEFEVCEANFQSLQWVEKTSLVDDQVLFLGPRCSKSICASQYNLKGNCIFFLDDDNCGWYWEHAPSSYDIRHE